MHRHFRKLQLSDCQRIQIHLIEAPLPNELGVIFLSCVPLLFHIPASILVQANIIDAYVHDVHVCVWSPCLSCSQVTIGRTAAAAAAAVAGAAAAAAACSPLLLASTAG